MMPTLRQRAANAITAMHAASTMFAMHAMLGRLAAQLKMPRPDAYTAQLPAEEGLARGDERGAGDLAGGVESGAGGLLTFKASGSQSTFALP